MALINQKTKIIVTGHTRGLGYQIFNHYNNLGYDVLGMSRSNGFNLQHDINKVIDTALNNNCKVFFNNAYFNDAQSKIIESLAPHMIVITSGSMASDAYAVFGIDNPYFKNKYLLEKTHCKTKMNNTLPMLLLKMGYLEDHPDKDPISYKEILSSIDYWFTNTRISIIEFANINFDKNIKKTL